jgi:hypothetical protein
MVGHLADRGQPLDRDESVEQEAIGDAVIVACLCPHGCRVLVSTQTFPGGTVADLSTYVPLYTSERSGGRPRPHAAAPSRVG